MSQCSEINIKRLEWTKDQDKLIQAFSVESIKEKLNEHLEETINEIDFNMRKAAEIRLTIEKLNQLGG